MNITPVDIILASQSPRRKALLEQAGITPRIYPADIDESQYEINVQNYTVALRNIAQEKAGTVAAEHADSIVVAADTIVIAGGEIFGKPKDEEDARHMLSVLSDSSHLAVSGLCAMQKNRGRIMSEIVETEVVFYPVSADDIDWYIASGEPFDKAGAYGIQGTGAVFVRGIFGSYTNIVGLPLGALWQMLRVMVCSE